MKFLSELEEYRKEDELLREAIEFFQKRKAEDWSPEGRVHHSWLVKWLKELRAHKQNSAFVKRLILNDVTQNGLTALHPEPGDPERKVTTECGACMGTGLPRVQGAGLSHVCGRCNGTGFVRYTFPGIQPPARGESESDMGEKKEIRAQDIVLQADPGMDLKLIVSLREDGSFVLERSAGCTLGHEVGLAVGLMRTTIRHVMEHLPTEDAARTLKDVWDQIVDDFGMVTTK
jgi:hypothetical protein